MSLDVFAEDPLDVGLPGDPGDFGPEVPGVRPASPASGRGEGLAWISGSEAMNAPTPRAAIEGSQVTPHRSVSQGLVRHPRHESGRGVSFSLDITNSSIAGLSDVQPEFEAADAGAEGQPGKRASRQDLGM